MEKNKRRSSLRQPPARDDDQAAAAGTQNCVLKRRISFSGKKSVREFVNTEEPHYWEDSYELSDCTNGEDNSREKAPKAGPSQQAPTADKENIPLQFEHPSTRIDMTLNLRTSIDVPRSVPRESLFAESLSLSSMGRDKLKDTLYSYPITDKTIDLMQISSKVREDCSELSSFEMEHMKTQPTKSVGDSFMDITPLGYTGPGTSAAAAVPVPAEKENVDPVQKLVHMEVEEGQKEIQRQADISFDWDMNDSDARDRLPSHGFFQTEPNNSTINYLGDESVLIPFDMISGENISKNLNFRQLNDDLEAGKIKVFANGPRTPCTDRKVKQMFWHGLDEDQDQDQDPMDINIRSIKPRATLNFSENMTMSPLAQTAPVAAVAEPLPREKLKIPDDKRKYRVSQADEMMLDNTNFLAHAKLGDETQSRNSSKVLSRRESTYESSEIDLGTPKRNSSCRQDFQPSTMQEAPSKHSKPRQTIHLPVEMEQDVFQLEEAAAAIPPGRASASARRTISLNESMDQENIVDEKATVIQSEDNVPRKHTISKRRETLLMEESMEEDIISPLKELHLKGNAHPAKGPKSRHTLHLAEPLEEDEVHPRNAAATEAISKDRRHLAEAVQEHLQMGNQRSKARQTILQEEPIEEDVDNAATGAIRNEAVQQNLPMGNQRSKARQTILQAEPIEEDVTATGAIQNKSFQPNLQIGNQRSKARQTILQSEAIVEDVDDAATGAIRKDYEHLAEAGQKHLPMGYQRSKARQTILQSEPIEEDVDDAATGAIRKEALQQNLPMGNQRPKARQTILQAAAIEEEFDYAATGAMRKDRKQLAESVQEHLPMANQRSKASQSILQSEAIEEDVDEDTGAIRKDYEHLAEAGQKHLPMGYQRSKARQTILQSEPIEEDVDDAATGAIRKEALQQNLPMGNQRPKARQTILQAAAIEEEFDYAATGAMRKDRKQLAESVQEHLPMANQRSKASQSILQSEAIEEDVDEDTGAIRKDYEHLAEAGQKHLPMGYQRSKARQTILQSEPIEEGDDDAATGAIRKEALQQNLPMGNQRPKARQTILQAAAIEEEFDYAATGAMRKDRKQLAESVQEHLPMANQRSKASQSILQSEAIEEDVDEDTGAIRKDYEHLAEAGQKHLPMGYQRSKARQTILQSEPIEKDVDDEATGAIRKEALQQNLPMGNQRPKARQTILQAAAIEEEFDYAATGAMRKDYEHLVEAVQEHHVPTGDRSSRSRQTLLTAVPIEEDHSIAYQSFKPRNTHESREESVAFKSKNTLMLAELIENMTAFRTSKARQTLLLATSMEEEEQLREPPLEKSTKVAPNRGSRAEQTLIMSESMEEEAEKADDFQSPLQSTGAPPELLPITPMLKQNRSGSLNSMKEFEQFEKDTNQAATPRSPLRKISALLRKFSSMGESMKMSLEGDASECGTPIRHSGDAKRLFAHLTPNLPEAKKRNTHLFGDMEMEQEMEASIAIKEVTAAVDMNFDLTLQPVRGLIGEHMSRPTVFEERPITVSDVSAYFQNQSGKVKKEPAEGTIEVEHGEKRDTCPRDSGSSTDRSFKSYAPTNKRFINLSGDTTIFSAAIVETIDVDQPENNQIDNVRLSLVSTLADEPDTDEEAPVEDAVALPKQPEPQPQPEPEPEPCQEQQESSRVVAAGSSASCRRCANCRRSLSEPRLSNDSFVLPTQPQWDLTREIEMLRRVRAKPNLDDVHKYWQMKEQERRTIALEKELDSSSEASEEEEFSEWDVNEVMATYKGEMERFKRNLADNQEVLQQMLVALEPVETFFDRLHDLLGEQQPNWIFDYQLKVSRKLIFTHRLLTTFRLIVDYETVDDLETAIRVCDINVEQATVILPLQSWTAFEHLLDFQLQLKLPVNLTDSIEGSSVEAFAQFLQRINAICVDILRTFHKLLTVLTATRTSLLRQVNRIVVKKTVRRHIEVDTRTRMEKTDFVIEIGNVEAISFRDILQPKLHFFNENIQFLPTGVAFLEAFLDHPEQYLKV
ncbi:uncharacterized protein LOC108161291 isoform X7 [Drosophila miranda]|uniref:uncharacterized protein LOC108161291 isoform X7 n=1 Tax=Drosophila miranda TaxID=7229 RepID=UPI00143F27F7|nr:uncharacterized protein LOC108161291 isoform X7 [Drosophila miranda]